MEQIVFLDYLIKCDHSSLLHTSDNHFQSWYREAMEIYYINLFLLGVGMFLRFTGRFLW
jgi:hypothetical protein